MGKAYLQVDRESLQNLFTIQQGQFITIIHNDIPANARLVNCQYVPRMDCYHLVFEHDDLPKIEAGEELTKKYGPCIADGRNHTLDTCYYCDSSDLTVSDIEAIPNGLAREVTCDACGRRWYDEYVIRQRKLIGPMHDIVKLVEKASKE